MMPSTFARTVRPIPAWLAPCVALAFVLCLHRPAAATEFQVQIHGTAAGRQSLMTLPSGQTEARFEFSDRGRGDHVEARWSLDAQGLPLRYEADGVDYWKAPLHERFSRDAGSGLARWESRIEHGQSRDSGFYFPANAPPEMLGVLARALRAAPGQRLRLLPAGEAWLEPAQAAVQLPDGTKLTLVSIGGIDFTPVPVWLAPDGASVAVLGDWFEVFGDAARPALADLRQAQGETERGWHARLAARQTHVAPGALLVRNARLFDPRDLTVQEGQSVLVRGDRIVRVGPDAQIGAPPDAEVIEAQGRFLMPGLWDVHQHFAGVDGIFDLIAGVTSARDMANDNLPMMARVARFDAGTELGPRVTLAGIIEGVGPYAGPTDVRVDTPEAARAAVDWYADHGYAQVKIYSSLRPALVPVVADRAHERGLRVSGHVPAFMIARDFVAAGTDEIQHLNFLVLNFFPEIGETRSADRYTRLAQSLARIDLDGPQVRDFTAFLRQHHTVLDPTLVTLEGLFSGAPERAAPALGPLVDRFPPIARRQLLSGALAPPAGMEDLYARVLPGLSRLLKILYDAQVPILPGSDAFAGYSLHRELELYARAGIPNAEVLRMATLGPARVLGVERDRGVLAPGKLADMILIDGDPLARISDIRHVYRTIRGGRVYDPAALERELGIQPLREQP